MWIICIADDSHEMPNLIFSEKKTKKQNQYVFFALVEISALREKDLQQNNVSNYPKYWDRQAWASSVDPNQMLQCLSLIQQFLDTNR